jgi:sporulation protein YlmC with PRC-barrel domain
MLHRIASTAAVLATLVAGAQAQQPAADQPATTTDLVTGGAPILTSIPTAMTTIGNYYKQTVYDPADKKIGEISDILLNKEGKVEVLIISVGGFLGIASKEVAVPFRAIQEMQKNGKSFLLMNTTGEALKAAPGYRYDKNTASWVPA